MTNDNLIDLVERIIPMPEDMGAEIRALPQVPDEWLNDMRKMLDSSDNHPSEWSQLKKIKFALKLRKCVKKMRALPGMPQHGELT